MKTKPQISFSLWQTITLILAVVVLTLFVSNKTLQAKLNFLPFLKAGVSQGKTISPKDLAQQLTTKTTPDGKQNFVLINVHTPYEGEIRKTDMMMSVEDIEKNLAQLPTDKNTQIIVYCKTGHMSAEAVKKLASLGYTNVSDLKGGMDAWQKAGEKTFNVEELKKAVLPAKGFALPISWGDIGPRLVSLGVIDLAKFKQAVQPNEEQMQILTKNSDTPIYINEQNAQFVVDMLWALGLAQKSQVYTDGPMGQQYKPQIGNFASTGGWTLARGQATNYVNKYDLIKLSAEQQNRVYGISQNIYRPCCGNPTSFPDCNHGMAALALVELMVSQNYSDDEIYKAVLGFNSFWFPQNYVAMSAYFAQQGTSWDKVDAKQALSQGFSSGQGAAKMSQEVGRLPYLYGRQSGGSCGA